MAHINQNTDKLLARVRRIKGQLAFLEKTLMGDGEECAVVLQQIAAVRGATNGLMTEVLEGHIRDHLGRADVGARERNEDVKIVLSALRSYMK